MISRFIAPLAFFLCLVAATPAHAQMKVGVVDMAKVFTDYYKTKDAEERINVARDAAKKEMDDRLGARNKLIEEINTLNKDSENPASSAAVREAKAKKRDEKVADMRNLERELNDFKTTRERQLQEQAARLRGTIVEEIMKVVNERVAAGAYELVFDKAGNSVSGVPLVLYSREGMDFTNEIITALNKTKSADSAATPKAAPSATPKPKK